MSFTAGTLLQRRVHPLTVVRLAGTQAEMGHQHGTLTRGMGGHQEVLSYYPRMPKVVLGSEGRLVAPLLQLALRRLERRRPQAYRARSRAFFRALGMNTGYSRNTFVMDLLQNVVGIAGRLGLGPFRRKAARAAHASCSTLAAWGAASDDGTLRHARNFDFPGSGIWERHPAVVFCTPDDGLRYGFVTTRGADVPGVTAFNEAGLTLTFHTCFHKHVRFDGIGAVDLGHEIIRKAESLDDAVRIACARPVASSWNVIVSSARQRSAMVLEINGQTVDVFRPARGEDFVACANRYRTNALRQGQVSPSAGFIANSEGRSKVLRRHALRGGLSVAELQQLLGTHEDPSDPARERPAGGVLAQGISVQSVVVEPEAERVHVSLGDCPTGLGPYATVDWSWDDAVGCEVSHPEPATLAYTSKPSRFETGPAQEAYGAYVECSRLQGQGAPARRIEETIGRAIELAPDEPAYRLIGAGFALHAGDVVSGLRHLEAGLEREWSPFHRGQLLLWASRAASAIGQAEPAQRYRAELAQLDDPLLTELQADAAAEQKRPFPRRRFRKIHVNVDFPDLIC